jgi:hypothetical protein
MKLASITPDHWLHEPGFTLALITGKQLRRDLAGFYILYNRGAKYHV